MKDVLSGIVIIALVIAGLFGLSYFGWATYNYFAPKYEQTRRDVFEKSRAFNEGMIRDLENLKMQYGQATPEQQAGLRAMILHRFSVYPTEQLPPDLQLFYSQLSAGAQP